MRNNIGFEPLTNQDQARELTTNVQSNTKNFGRYILIWRDQQGQPKFMLGPHSWLFILAFVFSIGLLGFLLSTMQSVLTPVWFWTLMTSSFLFALSYLNVGFSLPGVASRAEEGTPQQKQSSDYCIPCHIVRGRGVYHCQDCNVCISGYDHHCPWIGKCVGQDNLSAFYLFLIMTFGTLILCFIATMFSNKQNTGNITTDNSVFT